MSDLCRRWYQSDPILTAYHDCEWCRVCHEDRFQFEMLCLEGASVGLSWRTILHKRSRYKELFHNFDINACADMSDAELEAALQDPGIVRNRSKVYSVRNNARIVRKIQQEHGSFDAYLWGFTEEKVIDGHWEKPSDIPTVSEISKRLSSDLKRRGMRFVGPVITYSFLQSVGIVNDHLADCEYRNSTR